MCVSTSSKNSSQLQTTTKPRQLPKLISPSRNKKKNPHRDTRNLCNHIPLSSLPPFDTAASRDANNHKSSAKRIRARKISRTLPVVYSAKKRANEGVRERREKSQLACALAASKTSFLTVHTHRLSFSLSLVLSLPPLVLLARCSLRRTFSLRKRVFPSTHSERREKRTHYRGEEPLTHFGVHTHTRRAADFSIHSRSTCMR